MAIKQVDAIHSTPEEFATIVVQFIMDNNLTSGAFIAEDENTGMCSCMLHHVSNRDLLWHAEQMRFRAVHKRWPVKDEVYGGMT